MYIVKITSAEEHECGKKEYERKHGKHFNEKLYRFASQQLVNMDKTAHRFTKKEMEGIPEDTIYDMLFLADWLYSDLAPAVKETEIIALAKRYANDPDGYPGMAFCRWLTDMKNKEVHIPWEDCM